jgi:hypothetical protein
MAEGEARIFKEEIVTFKFPIRNSGGEMKMNNTPLYPFQNSMEWRVKTQIHFSLSLMLFVGAMTMFRMPRN